MKYVLLYSTMLLFTTLAFVCKDHWKTATLLLVTWGDYLLLTWYFMKMDNED